MQLKKEIPESRCEIVHKFRAKKEKKKKIKIKIKIKYFH